MNRDQYGQYLQEAEKLSDDLTDMILLLNSKSRNSTDIQEQEKYANLADNMRGLLVKLAVIVFDLGNSEYLEFKENLKQNIDELKKEQNNINEIIEGLRTFSEVLTSITSLLACIP